MEYTILSNFTNQLGQFVRIAEDPTHGDEAPLLAIIEGVIGQTNFYDTEDFLTTERGFIEPTEYAPILFNGEIIEFQDL